MTNAKHTPGPWSYKAGDSILYIQSKGIIAKVGIAGYWEKYSPEDEANARLISAAPDLLAALREFVHPYQSATLTEREQREKALAAIAKAEGKP